MKKRKIVTIVTAAIIGLTSCSNEELVDSRAGSEIKFRANSTFNLTRGVETSTLAHIHMYAVNTDDASNPLFMNNEVFHKGAGASKIYTSSVKHYWPKKADGTSVDKLYFYGIAPTTTSCSDGVVTTQPGLTVSASGLQWQVDDKIIPLNFSQQKDVMIGSSGKTTEFDANETGIEMNFIHPLSQIFITAKSLRTDEYSFKIKDIELRNFVAKATYTINNAEQGTSSTLRGTWTLPTGADLDAAKMTYTDDPHTTAISLENGSEAVSLMKIVEGLGGVNNQEHSAFIIPQTLVGWNPQTDVANTAKGAYIAVHLQINKQVGSLAERFYPGKDSTEEFGWVAIPFTYNLEAGKKYNIELQIRGGGLGVPEGDTGGSGSGGGKPVLGGEIKFNVTVLGWQDTANNIPLEK